MGYNSSSTSIASVKWYTAQKMICSDGKTALFSFLFALTGFFFMFAMDTFYYILFECTKSLPYVFILTYIAAINTVFKILYQGHEYQVSNFKNYFTFIL